MPLYEHTDRDGDRLYVSRREDRLRFRVAGDDDTALGADLDAAAVDRLIDVLQWWRGHRPQDCPADPAQRLTTLTVADVRGIVSEFLPAILPSLVAEYLERPAADNYPPEPDAEDGWVTLADGHDACVDAPACDNCGHKYTDHARTSRCEQCHCLRYRSSR